MSSAGDKVKIRLARSEYDDRILSLLRKSFGRRFTSEWWSWFSYASPYGRNRYYIATDNAGKVIGSYCMLPLKVVYNGKILKASLCNNVAVHPDFQGQGIFTALGRVALRREGRHGAVISLGVPNAKAYPGHMKVGWRDLATLSCLAKYGNFERTHSCTRVQRFDRRYDRFLDSLIPRFDFLVFKDMGFMNWRFVDRPDAQYAIFVSESKGSMRGYIVMKCYEEQETGYRKAHIMDIQAESQNVLTDLLDAAESFAVGCDELNIWTIDRNPSLKPILERGFRMNRNENRTLILHVNRGRLGKLTPSNWWFCYGDNDVY